MSTQNKEPPITIEAPLIAEGEQRISYDAYVKTLTTMGISVAKQERIQAKKARKNDIFVKAVSYPSIIFSALVVFSGFTQFSRSSRLPECGNDLWINILTTVFGLLALLFNVTRDFFKFDSKKINHDKGAKSLRAFFYTVDTYRNIDPRYGNRLEIINLLKNKLDDIMRNNPSISTELTELNFSATPPNSGANSSSTSSSSSHNNEVDEEAPPSTPSLRTMSDDIHKTFTKHYDSQSQTSLNLRYNLERLSAV